MVSDSSVSTENVIYECFFDGGTSVVLLFIAFLEEKDCVEMLVMMQKRLVFKITFLHSTNAENTTSNLP